jgi:hypothetical protein
MLRPPISFVNKSAQLSLPLVKLVRPVYERKLLEMVKTTEQQWYIKIRDFPLSVIIMAYR